MKEPSWREIEHTADWALEVWGETQADLFRNAALGVASLLGGRPSGEGKHRRFELQAPDVETLLVDWLTELLFWLETEGLVLDDVRFDDMEPSYLVGQATARPGAELGKHIKAVTYHDLAVQPTERGLKTTIVFDV